MNYWVLKGNPRTNDWDTMLQPGRVDLWHSGRLPKTLTSGDRLFCWESTYAGLAPDVDITIAVTEGGCKLVTHLVRERSQAIVAAKKQQILLATGQLICEVCGFNFNAFYGVLGEGFCEVHHRIPLSDVDSSRETRLEDFAIL